MATGIITLCSPSNQPWKNEWGTPILPENAHLLPPISPPFPIANPTRTIKENRALYLTITRCFPPGSTPAYA